MGQEPGTSGAAVSGAQDPDDLQREIEQTREELGDTVEALAAKTDVKAQAKKKLDETTASLSEKAEELRNKAGAAAPESLNEAGAQVTRAARENPMPAAAIGAFVAGFLVGRITKR
jgi:cell division septum initiation protein DivIVA